MARRVILEGGPGCTPVVCGGDGSLNEVLNGLPPSSPPLELLSNFPRLFRGTHLSHPKVRLLQAGSLRMECDSPVDFFADGEYHQQLPADLSVVPRALKIISPLQDSEGERA